MGMSTHIKAFIPDTNPEYQKHKEIFETCMKHEVTLPIETKNYFSGLTDPEDKLELELEEGVHYSNWADESSRGFEVNLKNLPKGVTKIRFYNSW